MPDAPVRTCPGCGQTLRFPPDVGGVLMACPSCGHRFASPFKLGGNAKTPTPSPTPPATRPVLIEAQTPPNPPDPAKHTTAKPNTQAARAAAKYAANS